MPVLRFLTRRGLAALVLLLVAAVSVAGERQDAGQLARAYAGLDQGAPAPGLDPGRLYRKTVGVSWDSYQRRLGQPMAAWASREIAPPAGGTVFYPFSGPDLVTVAQLFPDADRYVLVAIQRAQAPVDPRPWPAARRAAFFDKFCNEWQKFGVLGFFRTLDLDDDQQDRQRRIGVTPILMTFAARLGYEVLSVAPIGLAEDGSDYVPLADVDAKGAWNSVRLTLNRNGRQVLVDYVRLDLSDYYLKGHERQRAWLGRMAVNPVLLKAASHLLQDASFSLMRDTLVANAPLVVQDETGLDFEQLRKVGEVSLYGRFVRPYKLFDRDSQRSLAAAYRGAKNVGELPFSFSYIKSADQRSLQIARRAAARATGESSRRPLPPA